MALGSRSRVRMQFADGSAFDEWLSLEMRDSFTDPLGDVRFEAAPSRPNLPEYLNKLRKGELVTVFVNDANQGTFLIQTVTTRISKEGGVIISATCNTVLVTPYQGSVDPKLSFKASADAPIGTIVARALAPYGLDTVIDGDPAANVSALTGRPIGGGRAPINIDALKQDQACAQEGESAYQFCARIVTRLGVAMQVNFDGAVLLTVPDHDQDPAYSLVQSNDVTISGDRFFGDIEIADTNDNQFSECRVRGNPSDKSGATQTSLPDATVKASELFPDRPTYRSTAATYKPLILKDKNAHSIERCRSVAKLALGIRAKDAFTVTGAVAGFVSTTGRVWTANTIVDVRLDAIGFHEPMLILERTLIRNRSDGDITRLKLIPKGALVLGEMPGGA